MSQSQRQAGSREAPPWKRNTPEHRWYGFGRYYAMFPPSFAYDAVLRFTRPGESVLDPFCGRGNGPFTAAVLQRPSFGIDINPIAWLYTAVKLQPEADPLRLIKRLLVISRACRIQDRRGQSRFERMAWSPGVRAFLRAARRELDWMNSITDRTLMGFIALHMQDNSATGLSNRLWPTIACSPQYAVKWWSANGFNRPPDVEPVALLTDKILRRYEYGIPQQASGIALLADARDALKETTGANAKLLITSPPYNGVTDYWNDHWIRLWILGYSMRKDWKRTERYDNQESYRSLILDVFQETKRHLAKDAVILVRSDRRRRTVETCIEALRQVWPNRRLLVRTSDAPHEGVSVHHGRGGSRAMECDLLIPGKRGRTWWVSRGFEPIEQSELASLIAPTA